MSKKIKGFGLAELLVSMTIFSVLSALLFLLFSKGTSAILVANGRQQAQVSLNKTHTWLKRDLEQTRPNQVSEKRVPIAGNGDAVWFLSAIDPAETNPDFAYKRNSVTGQPLPQANVIYYLIRPSDYNKVSGGLPSGIDPDPTNDFFAPHKFLIRKVVDRDTDPTVPEALLTSAEVDAYLTAPTDYSLQPFGSEPDVVEYRLIADKMLSLEVVLDQNVVEVKSSALRIDEARKKTAIGSVSLKNNPLTSHREARFQLHQ